MDGQVRALCAQITLETDPTNREGLIGQLKILLGVPTPEEFDGERLTKVFSLREHKQTKTA
jgi:hypothetical protein